MNALIHLVITFHSFSYHPCKMLSNTGCEFFSFSPILNLYHDLIPTNFCIDGWKQWWKWIFNNNECFVLMMRSLKLSSQLEKFNKLVGNITNFTTKLSSNWVIPVIGSDLEWMKGFTRNKISWFLKPVPFTFRGGFKDSSNSLQQGFQEPGGNFDEEGWSSSLFMWLVRG